MQKVENKKNLIVKEDGKLADFLTSDAIKNRLKKVIGANYEQMITAIVSAGAANPELEKCSHKSILSCAIVGAGLNLSPSPQIGHYYFVPYSGNASFQLGYKGLIQLAIRSGQYRTINVISIKEGELIGFNPVTEEISLSLIEDIRKREKAKTIGYYAFFEMLNGYRKGIYWTIDAMLNHKNAYSKTNKFWDKHFEKMAYKTMIKQLIGSWGILSSEMQRALEYDEATISEDLVPAPIDDVIEVNAITIEQESEKTENIEQDIF